MEAINQSLVQEGATGKLPLLQFLAPLVHLKPRGISVQSANEDILRIRIIEIPFFSSLLSKLTSETLVQNDSNMDIVFLKKYKDFKNTINERIMANSHENLAKKNFSTISGRKDCFGDVPLFFS